MSGVSSVASDVQRDWGCKVEEFGDSNVEAVGDLAKVVLSKKGLESSFKDGIVQTFVTLNRPVIDFFKVCHISFQIPKEVADSNGYDLIIEYLQGAIEHISGNNELKSNFLFDLGCTYHKRGLHKEKESDLELAFKVHREALLLTSNLKLKKALLTQLRQTLNRRLFSEISSTEKEKLQDLLIETIEQQVDLPMESSEQYGELQQDYAEALTRRVNLGGKTQLQDLKLAIQAYAKAITLNPSRKLILLASLGDLFLLKYASFNEVEDLHLALETFQSELNEFILQKAQQQGQDNHLVQRFTSLGKPFLAKANAGIDYLDRVIEVFLTAEKISTISDQLKISITFQLANAYLERASRAQNGNVSDLDKGILYYFKGFQILGKEYINPTTKASLHFNLVQALIKRNQPGDLDLIIQVGYEALSTDLTNDFLAAELALKIALVLLQRNFPSQNGLPSDLSKAIEIFEYGLDLNFADNLFWANMCNEYVKALFLRNNPPQNNVESDVEYAIQASESALQLPFDQVDLRAHLMGQLARGLCSRNSLRANDDYPQDLRRAVSIFYEALWLPIQSQILRDALAGELDLARVNLKLALKNVKHLAN